MRNRVLDASVCSDRSRLLTLPRLKSVDSQFDADGPDVQSLNRLTEHSASLPARRRGCGVPNPGCSARRSTHPVPPLTRSPLPSPRWIDAQWHRRLADRDPGAADDCASNAGVLPPEANDILSRLEETPPRGDLSASGELSMSILKWVELSGSRASSGATRGSHSSIRFRSESKTARRAS